MVEILGLRLNCVRPLCKKRLTTLKIRGLELIDHGRQTCADCIELFEGGCNGLAHSVATKHIVNYDWHILLCLWHKTSITFKIPAKICGYNCVLLFFPSGGKYSRLQLTPKGH